MTKKWPTRRIAFLYGAPAGVLYTVFFNLPLGLARIGETNIVALIATIVGGALGGALLFAMVSGARNLILRAK